ncbi:MAG: Gfo/Idh/MocA family oxidoreductase [Planctomycetales bacterium]|nr:Gfo/Idh/MocA family oxidoreductase [Planctomycetales bacterium]
MHIKNRRDFLKVAVTSSVGAASCIPTNLFGFHQTPATRQLRIGFIGVGGRGAANLAAISADPNVTVAALCDVDQRKLVAANKLHGAARLYADFRELYQQADDLDAIVVSTAEHTHAYATMPALRMKKHVYCEKPLTHNVVESRAITAAAKEAGVSTQMGTQIHASENYHQVVAKIQGGAIGPVREVHVWVGRAWGLQSKAEAEENKDRVYVTKRPSEGMPVPEYLNWDLWLGPAAYRPYHEIYFPGPNWYRWWEFGNGTMSDLGSHWNDLPYWALQLDAPTSVDGVGPQPDPELAPASMTAVYQYAARGELPPCQLTWYQGTHKPPQWEDKEIPQWSSGVLFVGESGSLLSDYGKHLLLPEEDFVDYRPPILNEPVPASHHQDWLDSIQTGSPTGSPFSYAGPLTEANHLGNVAFRAGGRIEWDAAAMRITNNEQANQYLSRQPRDGWSLDTI